MTLPRSISGRMADIADGPIGSAAWVQARHARFERTLEETPEERAAMLAHLAHRLAKERLSPPRERPSFDSMGLETALSASGRLEPIADHDDGPGYGPVDDLPAVAERIEAERIYNEICDDECGIIVNPEHLEKKRKEKAILRAQSHAIARKLELAKVTAYRSGDWSLWVYGIHSGEVEAMPQFRRVAFIPFVGAQIREPFIRELEFYLQSNPFARFWTLTGGKKVRLCDLREAIRRLAKRIRKLNAQPFMHEAGVRIVFRSIELGTIEKARQKAADGKGCDLLDETGKAAGTIERDSAGTLWFHPHAHCLVELENGRLSRSDWSAFLVRLRAYWGDWMDDGGCIRSAREAVKYVTKPGEIQHLTPDETAALFEQLRRLKIVQPLGSLADAIRAREEAGRTLIRVRTDDGFIWREVGNWNSRPKTDQTKHRVCVRTCDELIGPEFADLSERDMKAAARMRTESDKADVDACVVVARCTPSASSLGVKEPRVVVMGKRWDAARVNSHPLVERLWMRTYDAWRAGLALIRVHTGTPSVPEPRPLAFVPDLPERVRPQTPPVFASK